MPDRIKAISITSASYSGSTWLNLMLGAHSHAFSVGELKAIDKFGQALCTLHGENCAVWPQFNPDSDEPWLHQIARIAQSRFLVLNNPRQYTRLLDDPDVDVCHVHLVRDGRAVAASMMRKYPKTSIWKASRHWTRTVRKNKRRLRRRRGEPVVELCYERAIADPARTAKTLCDAFEMEYEPDMLQYWNVDHHFLGGNHGTLVSMLREQGAGDAAIQMHTREFSRKWTPDRDFYDKVNVRQFRDERWKDELSDRQLRVFALVAGRLNRQFGYPASLDRVSRVA